jgi:glucuronokinase
VTRTSTGHATARAALAGNPSDLHGGAVIGIPVPTMRATVTLGSSGGTPAALIQAALARVGRAGAGVEWDSTIPRSVGLAGSSALVIAALRASGNAPEDALALADLALSIERDDLGIVAGLQDRAVQAFEAPVLVDLVADQTVRVLTPSAPLEFVVVWRVALGADSGDYHAARPAVGSAAVQELARIARGAAAAFEAGDASALANLMALSADVRREVAPLPPGHDSLAEAVHRAGFSPNSTGSGGAVVAVVTERSRLTELPKLLSPLDAEYVTLRF